ncbi:MAG: Sortase (Surface protein transpeptidase) [Candidatus Curtissbacteria bacterium GW2011_GWA1_40_9]|uniref:Sortase (Surface protein transpeptidase) n=1 Tax=Candidatus Curtissbacteria bacterium GW2011_GWA1_40_9 TaxID=1618408 RepID=A0A0G0W157_9BACT|nr:MAG: Sortase (Surface protein transpeptidase) [Candidatus Curtissbacteria bacterium GW2011_GWA1_40_9]
MNLDIYSKDPPRQYDFEKSRKKDRIFSFFILGVGIASIVFIVGPLLIWSFTAIQFTGSRIENMPVPQEKVLSLASGEVIVQEVQDEDGFSYFTTDYRPQEARPKIFYVSIPKLGINKALTKVDTLAFYENLSHFPGTALPGEVGNVFITGHSALPQFADRNDFNTIFSKLSDLEVGDIVDVEFEGNKYRYLVQYKKIVDPKDLSVLKPISKGAKNLTLMTCVPPGTSIKRMVVITGLI